MLPKADSGSFVLFSLLFVLTLTDPPRTGIDLILMFFFPKERQILLLLLRVFCRNGSSFHPIHTEAPARSVKASFF